MQARKTPLRPLEMKKPEREPFDQRKVR